MIPGIVAAQFTYTTPSGQVIVFPLTYDQDDSTGSISLTRQGGQGPHVTPFGFEGDGYSSRYTTTSLPSWVNSDFTLQASITSLPLKKRSAHDVFVHTGANDSGAAPRLTIETGIDPKGDTLVPNGVITLRAGANSLYMGRPGWKQELRVENATIGGYNCLVQGVAFIDANTLIYSVHLEDTESRVYKVDLTDNSIIGEFTFGTSTNRHVASIAFNSSGECWMADYETGNVLRIDLASSFSSGTAVIDQTYTGTTGLASIAFMTISGTEYWMAQLYDTTEGTLSYLYVFAASELANSGWDISRRVKRFQVGRRAQGIVGRNGNLVICRNNRYGQTSPAGVIGCVQTFNISGMLSSLADGSTVNSSTNSAYLLSDILGPSSYVEDMAVHPTSNRLFIGTEGGYAVADSPGYLAIWSSDLTDAGEKNTYRVHYDGADTYAYLNGNLFGTVSGSISQTGDVLSIGGLPAASAGFTTGYAMGFISNVAICEGDITQATSDDIASGSYELNSLTVYTLTLTNPGAESGSTTGWTAEIGGMAVRSANPPPYAGSYYFSGGSNVQSVSRQRLDLVAQGLSTGDLDAGTAWAKVRWQQAAYTAEDPGSMGVRVLNGSSSTLDTQYAPFAWTPFGGGSTGPWYWYPRCFPMTLPTTTRYTDALYNASGRTSGTNNDFFVDNVQVIVYVP